MTTHQYQLTRHPVGSLKEIWTLSWPLMISLMSGSLMMFVDRLFLAHYSIDAMNALAVAGITSYLLLVLPLAIIEITEVYVGRFHGEGSNDKLSLPAWQMLLFSLIAWPLVSFAARPVSYLLFQPNSLEEQFLITWIDWVTPSLLGSVTLMGFFIAIGKTRVITTCTVVANILNIVLVPLLIFGTPLSAPMGIKGTAIASSCAQLFQFVCLLVIFLRNHVQLSLPIFDKKLLMEMCKVGLPTSLGRAAEVLAHSTYFQIMALAGKEALTCATIIQSFYLLVMFFIDAIAKSTTAVISNLLGANIYPLIPKAMSSAYRLHFFFFLLVLVFCYIGTDFALSYILAAEDLTLLNNPDFRFSLRLASFWMCLFFLFDGFAWISAGFLTAMKDTKFIFTASVLVSWVFYVLPVYLLVTYAGAGGATGWSIIALSVMLLYLVYTLRARYLMQSLSFKPLSS